MPPPMMSHRINDRYKVPHPKNLRELPRFLATVFKNFFSRLFYIFQLVWETSPLILFAMLFISIFSGVLPVIGALISRELMNTLAKAYVKEISDFSIILVLLIFQFVYLWVNSLTQQFNHFVTQISGELVRNHIKVKIMNKAKSVDIGSYDLPDFHAKLENANREASNRPIQILSYTFTIMSTIISLVSFIAVLYAVSPIAPVIIIAFSLPSAIINFVYRRKNADYVWRRSKDRRQMNYYNDTIVNKDLVKEMKLYDLSDSFIDKYKSVFGKYFGGMKRLIMQEAAWNSGANVLSTAVNCLLFIYIALGVFEGRFQIGDYSLYTVALNTIASGIASLISSTAGVYEGTLFINNMISFMDEEQKIVPTVTPALSPARHIGHKIEFCNVSFCYPGTDKPVLRNINLTLSAGETVVIVGLNGAGKTTLLKLLTRLYDPTDGVVLLDGRDIREYDTQQLYRIFGIIFQDFGRYSATVAENIAFGQIDLGIDEQRVRQAAVNGNADEFIEQLPQGYDTTLMRWFEDNGIELSIGQWQKLSVARAFYSDSDILILDEPTASLDPMAEQEIYNQFDALRHDKTTIFVSHRLSSATTADKIVVLEHGEIVEIGDHRTLMEQHGKYHRLFSTQAKRYTQ